MAIQYNQSSTDYNALEHEYGGAGTATYEPGYRLKGEKYRSVNYQYRGGDSFETHAITAAVTGSATATAALLQGQFVTGAVTGTGTVVAAIDSVMITGAFGGAATVTAAIVEGASLTAAITGTATVAATIFSAQFVDAAVTGTGAATAAIVRERPITAAVTGTGTVTAVLIEEAFIEAGVVASATVTAVIDSIMISGGFSGVATLSQPIITHKVPQPELTITIKNITGSSNAEELQDTLTLLVGV